MRPAPTPPHFYRRFPRALATQLLQPLPQTAPLWQVAQHPLVGVVPVRESQEFPWGFGACRLEIFAGGFDGTLMRDELGGVR